MSKTFLLPGFDIPIIGTNGARTSDDILRFLSSGARAIEIVSLLWLHGYAAVRHLIEDTESALAARSESVEAIVGRAARAARGYAEIPPVVPRPEPWRSVKADEPGASSSS